jgi:hypothetical protein
MNTSLKLKSQVCLTPNQCYPVESEFPIWLMLVFGLASVFVLKEIYNSIKS